MRGGQQCRPAGGGERSEGQRQEGVFEPDGQGGWGTVDRGGKWQENDC